MQLFSTSEDAETAILDVLPNPVMIKDADLRYVWVNKAFETLFEVTRDQLVGLTDAEFFVERQAVQCTGGDMRVLESGVTDEAYETVFSPDGQAYETLTRKNRLVRPDGSVFLVGTIHDITAIRRQADTDPLTACLNRRSLDHHVSDAFSTQQGFGSLMLIDIDHFKSVNDTYGHDAGDAALIHFSEVLRSLIRKDDRLARVGGEEFALALPGTPIEQACDVADRIQTALAASPLEWEGREIELAVSIGIVAKFDDRPFILADWLPIADERLYRAKAAGRDCVVSSS